MTWLLRLYPRAWRERYGDELREVVEAQPASFFMWVDLLAGAIDAHLAPQRSTNLEEGENTMIGRLSGCCASPHLTRRESRIAAAISLLSSLALAGALIVNSNQLVESMVLCSVPAVLVTPTQWFVLRNRSALAKWLLIGGPLLVSMGIGAAAGMLLGD